MWMSVEKTVTLKCDGHPFYRAGNNEKFFLTLPIVTDAVYQRQCLIYIHFSIGRTNTQFDSMEKNFRLYHFDFFNRWQVFYTKDMKIIFSKENAIPERREMVNRFDPKWLKMAKNFVIDLKCSYEKRRFCHKILAYRLDIQFHKGIFIMVRNIQLFKFVCANSMKLWFNAKYKILYGMSRIPMPVPLPLFNKALPQIQWSYLINNKIG